MPATSYPKAIGGVCQNTIDYPACRCWTVKRSDSMATNCIWPYKGHTQKAPDKLAHNASGQSELREARHAIPEFTMLDKLSQSSIRGDPKYKGD